VDRVGRLVSDFRGAPPIFRKKKNNFRPVNTTNKLGLLSERSVLSSFSLVFIGQQGLHFFMQAPAPASCWLEVLETISQQKGKLIIKTPLTVFVRHLQQNLSILSRATIAKSI
jgi:hypothetical protein